MTIQMSGVQRLSGRLLLPASVLWGLFLVYLAVLPLAGTIALRNVLLGVLALQALLYCFATYEAGDRAAWIRRAPPWLFVWTVFLLLFPFGAQNWAAAWGELRGQWLGSLLAWAVAFFVASRRSLSDADLLSVVLASAFYPVLYLILFLWAWMGGFGFPAHIEDISRGEFLALLTRNVANISWPSLTAFPWGFRGFDPIHANLGAAAAHTCIAALAWGVARRGKASLTTWAGFSLFFCAVLMTPVLAVSRASFLAIGVVFLLAAIIVGIALWRGSAGTGDPTGARRWPRFAIAALCVTVVLGLLVRKVYEQDPRWQTLYYKATIGFVVPDALSLVCNGIGPELESGVRSRLAGKPPAVVADVVQGMGGDGARALVMRVGLELVLENPFGVDGSRNAYKHLIHERCGKEPGIAFVHPHQGWIDLALALGWAGALLYFGLFLYLIWMALANLSTREWTVWGVGLLMLCAFWLLRGFFDSVYREHYLQMQAALIGFFWKGLLQEAANRRTARLAALDGSHRGE